MNKNHPWRNRKPPFFSGRQIPENKALEFFRPSAPPITPTIMREFEITIEYQMVERFFGERSLIRSKTIPVLSSSPSLAEKKAMEQFWSGFARERTVIVGIDLQ